MQYLYDDSGHRYSDFYSGVTVMNCGHCNPAVIEPAIAQIRQLQHTTTIYLTRPIYELARALVRFLDSSHTRVFFVNSGTEANEGALLLSRLRTGKAGFIGLNGGLHGRSSLTMALTGIDMWRTDPAPPPGIHLAPRPCCRQCELGKTFGSCGYACVDAVGDILSRDANIAALIAEPIQGNGGIVEPPPGYFERLQPLLHKAGALLIFDEVQTGFGRTGARFCFKHLEIEPDIVTVAKALGNGFPIAAFCATEAVASVYTRPGASTTGGNAVSAVAALAVLDTMTSLCLPERAAALGKEMKRTLCDIADRHAIAVDVRGRGLMLGMELARDGQPAAAEADDVLEAMKDRGFLIGKTGTDRNVLTFMPPLIVESQDIDGLCTALDEVLAV